MESPNLDTPAAGERVGLAGSTLEKLRMTGRGPRYVKLGRSVRYRPRDLDEWVAARVRERTADKALA